MNVDPTWLQPRGAVCSGGKPPRVVSEATCTEPFAPGARMGGAAQARLQTRTWGGTHLTVRLAVAAPALLRLSLVREISRQPGTPFQLLRLGASIQPGEGQGGPPPSGCGAPEDKGVVRGRALRTGGPGVCLRDAETRLFRDCLRRGRVCHISDGPPGKVFLK